MTAKTTDNHIIGHRARVKNKILELKDLKPLNNYEIIEALLFYTNPRIDVKPIAKNLTNNFENSISKLLHAEINELKKIDGVGDSFICLLKLVKELNLRASYEKLSSQIIIESFDTLTEYLQNVFKGKKVEEFRVIFLNSKNKIISDVLLTEGTVNKTAIYPREIVKKALELSSSSVIISHNHPSGDPTPSKADIEITSTLLQSLKTVEIKLWDHVIIADQSLFSFRMEGLIL